MGTDSVKVNINGVEGLALDEQQLKINEVRKLVGPLSGKLALYCSDSCIARYLRARNGNVKKATNMLKASLKWRLEYKPEEIRWDDIAAEAETGKIYRANYKDKTGRPVLVMRPAYQNTKSVKGQIKFLVYCMENAILNLPSDQEQMVWLIDFHGFNVSHISVKVSRETAHVLQEHYPERLGVAVMNDAPKIFEPFYKLVKPFLEPKTAKKVNFVYSGDLNSQKIMEELFDKDQLEVSLGGNEVAEFEIRSYGERMREDDKKMQSFWKMEDTSVALQLNLSTNSLAENEDLESDSETLDKPPNQDISKEINLNELSVSDGEKQGLGVAKN